MEQASLGDPDVIFQGHPLNYIKCAARPVHDWDMEHPVELETDGVEFDGQFYPGWRRWVILCDLCNSTKEEIFDAEMVLRYRDYERPIDWWIEGYNKRDLRREAKLFLMLHTKKKELEPNGV